LLEFSTAPRRAKLASDRQPHRITVVISSVACEGMRLVRPEPIDELKVGSRIKIRLFVDRNELCLPGHVAWMLSSQGGETNVGVSLALELADANTRGLWAHWVVSRSEQQASAGRRRSGNHSVVSVRPSALLRAASDH
jgi:hypothetical protein